MTRWLPFALPVALALAFLLGWTFPGRPDEPLGVTRGARPDAGLSLRPGESTAEAVRFLRTLRSDPPPPPPPPPPPVEAPPPPPPPPPDVSVVFRQALAGVSRDPRTGVLSALVRDPSTQHIAAMKVGDVFVDRWRLSEITAVSVTLRRGSETRVVGLYG